MKGVIIIIVTNAVLTLSLLIELKCSKIQNLKKVLSIYPINIIIFDLYTNTHKHK